MKTPRMLNPLVAAIMALMPSAGDVARGGGARPTSMGGGLKSTPGMLEAKAADRALHGPARIAAAEAKRKRRARRRQGVTR